MIGRVLLIITLLALAVFVIAWLASGAAGDISARKDAFPNPLKALLTGSSTPGSFRLPTYTVPYPNPIDINDAFDAPIIFSDARADSQEYHSLESDLLEAERELDSLSDRLRDAREFGNPSPSRGAVVFAPYSSNPQAETPSNEYVVLSAGFSNTAPVNITGWSLQSMVTGTRVFLPQGERVFRMGEVGNTSDIYLDPGAEATAVSGVSPLGVSFRENTCAGYLDQFQSFSPPLKNQCPRPRDELPGTADNYNAYGVSCVDFVKNLPACEYYIGTFPSSLSDACQNFIRGALTYNSCVSRNEWRPSFSDHNWRVFLSASGELWRNDRDIIRLLDTEGRTVDVWTY